MQTRLFLELDSDSKTNLYSLPFRGADLPLGAYIPPEGEEVVFPVFKPIAGRQFLENRNFKVVNRHSWIHCAVDEQGTPFRSEVTLVLRDLGSVMTNEQGLGALGLLDPVYQHSKQ